MNVFQWFVTAVPASIGRALIWEWEADVRRLLNTLYVTNPDALVSKRDDAISVSVGGERVMSEEHRTDTG